MCLINNPTTNNVKHLINGHNLLSRIGRIRFVSSLSLRGLKRSSVGLWSPNPPRSGWIRILARNNNVNNVREAPGQWSSMWRWR